MFGNHSDHVHVLHVHSDKTYLKYWDFPHTWKKHKNQGNLTLPFFNKRGVLKNSWKLVKFIWKFQNEISYPQPLSIWLYLRLPLIFVTSFYDRVTPTLEMSYFKWGDPHLYKFLYKIGVPSIPNRGCNKVSQREIKFFKPTQSWQPTSCWGFS